MEEIKEINFSTEPDFLGQRDYTNPIGFFLHPEYANGNEFLITLDWKISREENLTGEPMTGQCLNALIDEGFNAKAGRDGQEVSRRALDYHLKEAEKAEDEE